MLALVSLFVLALTFTAPVAVRQRLAENWFSGKMVA
jgi:hypothetical protein